MDPSLPSSSGPQRDVARSLPLEETLKDWLRSPERDAARLLAPEREAEVRTTGLVGGEVETALRESFDRVAKQITKHLQVPVSLFSLLEGDCQVILGSEGVPGLDVLPKDSSLCVHVRDSGRDLIIDDLSRSLFAELAENATAAGVGSYLGTPVFGPSGEPIGSLCAIDMAERSWEPSDLNLLKALAEGLTDKIALAMTLEEARRERGRAERSEIHLRGVIEAIPHLVVLTTVDEGVDFIGPQVRTILGYEPEEMLGFGLAKVIHPEDRDRFRTERAEFLGQRKPFERELRFRHADGSDVAMLARGFPLEPEADPHHNHIITFTDISQIRAVEADLHEERRRLRGVIDVLPTGLMLSDEKGTIVLANEESRKIFGDRSDIGHADRSWPQGIYLGLDGRETPVTTLNAPIVRALSGESVRNEQTVRVDYEDGSVRYVTCDAEPLRNPEGEIEGAVMVTADVTALRKAEDQVEAERRAGVERLQAMLDAMPIFVSLVGLDGRLLHVNRAPVEAIGKTLEEVLGKVVWEEWTSGDPEATRTLREVIEAGARGERVTREITFHWHDRVIETEYHVVPIRDAEGNVTALSTSAVDVTERNEARLRVEAEGDMMRQLMEHSPIMMGLCDPEGRVIYTNEPPLRAAGTTLDEVRGRLFWETTWTQELGMSEILHDACLRAMKGEVVLSEISFPSPEGGMVEVETRVAPILAPNGELIYLLPTSIDVTARNRALRAVQAEGVQLRQIMDNAPVMMALLDVDGRVLYANEARLRAFGLTLEEVQGSYTWDVRWGENPNLQENLRAAYLRVAEGETVLQEFSLFDHEGNLIEVEHRTDPIRDENGVIRAFLSSSMDMTARRQAARIAEEERARLRTILDILPAGLLIADADGHIIDGNVEGLRLFGKKEWPLPPDTAWPRAWYLEFDGSETLIPVGGGPMPAALRGESVRDPRTIRTHDVDGTVRYIQCDAQPLLTSEGEVAGSVMTILDITTLRQARDAADRARLESIARLQRVIDSLPINVVLADPEGRLLYANTAPLKAAGLELTDIVGQIAWESAWMPNEETAQITREEYMKAAAGQIARREFSIRLGESIAEVDHTVVPIFDSEGKVEFLLPSSIDVTERNQALREVDAERRRLSQTVEGMPVGLFVFDKAMNLLQANDEAVKATGLTPERLESGELPELSYVEPDGSETPISPLDAPSWRALRGEGGRETRPLRLHRPGTDPSEDRFVHIEAAPLTNAAGEIEGAIVTAVDVKPLLEAEKALARERAESAAMVEEERRRLRQIVDSLPIGLFVFDTDRRILQANEEGLAAFGLSRDQMEASDYPGAVYIEADGSEIPATLEDAPLRRVLRGEPGREPRTMRLRYPGADPTNDRFVRAEAAALTDESGEIEGAVFTVVDVKPLHDAEQALLRERETETERLQKTLDGLAIFCGLLDLEGRILYCNRAPMAASGITFEDIDGVRFEDSYWVADNPEMGNRLREATYMAAAGRMVETTISARRIGGHMDVDIALAPIRGEEGEIKYILASGIDVTQRNAALRQLEEAGLEANDARVSAERAKEAAERATRAKDEFLAVLSHELRTPLTPAMLGLELMQADIEAIRVTGVADAETRESLVETFDAVRTNLSLQVRLIDDLLDITRIARGKLELHKVSFDLHDAARHAATICAADAEAKGVEIILELDAETSGVHADPARIRQILWNLVANAVKFTPAGGKVTLTSCNTVPGRVEIEVCDTGRGIASSNMHGIFDAFEQGGVGVTRAFGGLGLGLAISRSLALAHSARLSAHSEGLGKGACFVLDMAVATASRDSESIAAPIENASGVARHLLLVEDNAATARVTAALLRRAGAQVVVAGSVAQAKEIIATGGPWDALVTDLGLPDGDGFDVLQILRNAGIKVPAIAMSGFGSEDDKARTSEAGFATHLVKPIEFDQLRRALALALG